MNAGHRLAGAAVRDDAGKALPAGMKAHELRPRNVSAAVPVGGDALRGLGRGTVKALELGGIPVFLKPNAVPFPHEANLQCKAAARKACSR